MDNNTESNNNEQPKELSTIEMIEKVKGTEEFKTFVYQSTNTISYNAKRSKATLKRSLEELGKRCLFCTILLRRHQRKSQK